LSEPIGPTPLSDGEIRKRRDRLTDFLDVCGDLRVGDYGSAGVRRLLEFALDAPGQDLPVEIKARYREYYRRARPGEWHLAKYHYECFDVARGRRLAYHLHDIGTRRLVAHAHCEDATDLAEVEGSHHLRAIELDLREAHSEFMALWASDTAPDCNRLLPLGITRTF
jgi:hypothetical protein